MHSFTGGEKDGSGPVSSLLRVGNRFYGTTGNGGRYGKGTVFSIAQAGSDFTLLYSFKGQKDGSGSAAGLSDAGGTLYGTTYYGGVSNSGSVFQLAPDGTETVLHSFTMAEDGAYPYAGLIRDKQGNLYGTAEAGGEPRLGVVFKISSQ